MSEYFLKAIIREGNILNRLSSIECSQCDNQYESIKLFYLYRIKVWWF